MNVLAHLSTPAAIVDAAALQTNITRMQQRMDALGVHLRPHVKTSKCPEVVRHQVAAGAQGITVSTLKEAEQFFAEGVRDILYAVGIAPGKLTQVQTLRARGCDLKIITDNLQAATAIADFAATHGADLEVWIEIDTDGHRSGVKPEDAALTALGQALHRGPCRLGGVMTHAGASYALDTPEALRAMAEQERAGCVRAAQRLRAAGLPCPVVSVGSTPTACSAEHLQGVTEVRAGVYAFFDLVMLNVGVCQREDIALSVLTTVIGHQAEKGWAIVDAGWMAMSRDRGTQAQRCDYGYGQVCDADGRWLDGLTLVGANQEHGIVGAAPGQDPGSIVERLPVGTLLRILPNHACATAAQFPSYHVLAAGGGPQVWPRFGGW